MMDIPRTISVVINEEKNLGEDQYSTLIQIVLSICSDDCNAEFVHFSLKMRELVRLRLRLATVPFYMGLNCAM